MFHVTFKRSPFRVNVFCELYLQLSLPPEPVFVNEERGLTLHYIM